jgi:protoporphyrinogen oxidase
MKKFAILGAGMAGVGAAHRLHGQGVRPVIYEKHSYHGGHTASFKSPQGFIFDEGPHVSFTGDARIQDLLAESVNYQYETVRYGVNNYWQGHWIKHPAHCNLYGLPANLVVDILRDFIAARDGNSTDTFRNYEDWLIASYGEKFARTFPMEYTIKYHTTTAANMSTDWLGPRMYRPKLEEVLYGSVSPTTPDYHYVTEFRYPSREGFVAYFDLFLRQADFKLGHELVRIDPKERQLYFSNGNVEKFDGLISSVPLPDLVPLIAGVPKDVLESSQKLACTSCILVNLGVDREGISEHTVTYFYDHDFSFTRLSFPHLMSPNNAPRGTSSIQAEVYFSKKYRPLNCPPEHYVQPVIADLRRCGLLTEEDTILFSEARVCPYANVIFDLERAPALKTVHGYLDDIGIGYCGRYGDWQYTWTDEAFKSGENAAQKIFDRTGS